MLEYKHQLQKANKIINVKLTAAEQEISHLKNKHPSGMKHQVLLQDYEDLKHEHEQLDMERNIAYRNFSVKKDLDR